MQTSYQHFNPSGCKDGTCFQTLTRSSEISHSALVITLSHCGHSPSPRRSRWDPSRAGMSISHLSLFQLCSTCWINRKSKTVNLYRITCQVISVLQRKNIQQKSGLIARMKGGDNDIKPQVLEVRSVPMAGSYQLVVALTTRHCAWSQVHLGRLASRLLANS